MKGNIFTRAGMALGIIEPVPTQTDAELKGGQLIVHRGNADADPRTLDSVYRALFIIETACKQLSLDVWRQGELLEDVPSIVRRPDVTMTQKAFIAMTVNSLAQAGNAYWIKQFNRKGILYGVRVLNPRDVIAVEDATGGVSYSYKGKPVQASHIIHMRLTHRPGEVYGLSPIQACMQTLTGALNLRSYADNWTSQSGRPTGILTTDQQLTADQAKTWKKQANASMTPGNGIAVFGHGLSYRPLLLTPEEMQFLEAQNANVVAVARMFGIPARLILASLPGGSQTYANLEQDELTFLRYTLMAYLSEIESAFDQLTANGQTVRFNLDALLRTDTKTRYEAHQIGINAGFLTPAEVRDIEGLPNEGAL
ncbi:phage portal protein [Arcanobacterium haemolyticum]